MQAGIIEGFYGEDWGWSARMAALPFLAARGMRFFLYAPKGDRSLRLDWRTPHDARTAKELRDFGAACRQQGLAFGVGLTPYKLHETWSSGAGRADFEARVRALAGLRLDWLAILFDDMRGDMPHLARSQAEIIDAAAQAGDFSRLLMCPTYYSDQEILDRLFGRRPPDYLQTLGRLLDPEVGVFWTGPRVVSPQYPDDHLQRVTEELGRKPVIWDNYPVNDGPRMSRFLHLRAPDRPASLRTHLDALAINPMNQAWLSRIPIDAALHSLDGHAQGSPDDQTEAAIQRLLAAEAPLLVELLRRDWRSFQDEGLDKLPSPEKQQMIQDYAVIDHPAAREVTRWLKGEYIVSEDVLTDT